MSSTTVGSASFGVLVILWIVSSGLPVNIKRVCGLPLVCFSPVSSFTCVTFDSSI